MVRKTYPSYDLQPLLKRQQELEEARAFNNWLGERRLAQGAAAPGREPADGGSAPPGAPAALRARRAQGRGTRGGRSCHGFNQRPRFEQVVGYLERNEPPWTSRTARPRSSRSHFYLDDFAQPLQHTPLRAIPEKCDLPGSQRPTR